MKKKKLKIAFGIFFSLVGLSIMSGMVFLESRYFASIIKRAISERSPKSLGVVGDFSHLKLYLFPPGIGFANPKVQILENNLARLPLSASIEASELRLDFAPIQMLSGTLQVANVLIKDGSLIGTLKSGALKARSPRKKSVSLSWDEVLELQINGVEFENTFLSLEVEDVGRQNRKLKSELVVKHLVAEKSNDRNHPLLRTSGFVNAVRLEIPEDGLKLPFRTASELEWDLSMNDTGIDLSSFRLQLFGMELNTKGKIRGNILDSSSSLGFEVDASLRSDLEEFFSANGISEETFGQVDAFLRVKGDLKDIEKTLKGSYQLKGRDLRWREASVAELEGEGQLDLDSRMLRISEVSFFQNHERAKGGEIRITEGSLPLDSPLSGLNAKISLKNSPIHWAGGAVLKSVYPLEGELNGNIEVSTSRNKMELKPNLQITHFGLNNQKYKVSKPYSRILKPKETIHLTGVMAAQTGRLDFQQVKVEMKNLKLDVSGSINQRNGIELQARGPVDLSEMDEIAENPIRGKGSLEATIRGDSDGVVIDFDHDLKDAEYLQLKFGEAKGRITYEGFADELRFSEIKAKKGNTFYSLKSGVVDLGDSSRIELPLVIHSGKIEDLAQILETFVKKVSWYPAELKGEVQGQVLIHGKSDFAKMQIDSTLEGVDWSLHGERARKIRLNAGYDQGTYYARNVVLYKTAGAIKGLIEFDSQKEKLNWDFETESFSFNDLDFFQRLEIPARSKMEIKSTGSGKFNQLVSSTSARLDQTLIKGEVLEPSLFTLEVGESMMRASLDVFGKKLQASFKYALVPKQPSSLNVEFNRFDFSPLILILNPKLLDDPSLLGLIDGSFQFDFLSTQSELARGEIRLERYQLKKSGFSLNLAEPIRTPIQLGYFSIPPSRLEFNDSSLILSGEGKRGDVDLTLKGVTDLGIACIFSSSLQKVEGKAETELRISGPIKNPRFNGDFKFDKTRIQMSWLQSPFEELDGLIRIRQNTVDVEKINGYLGEEIFGLSGKIELYSDRFPKIDLKTQFSDNKVKMLPLELVQVRGAATIKGDHPPYLISGSFDVPQALWTKSFSGSGAGASRVERFAPVDRDQKTGGQLFELDLNVNAPKGFVVRNEVLDGEFKGKVRLIGSPESPRLLGEGQLVQGKVLFRDRPFIFDSVKIVFDDPYLMNPKFNAVAVSEINQYKVRVIASGSANSWRAEFSSTPYLAESEIFSLLASGLTTTTNNRFRTRDRTYVNQGEAASLVLHSMDFGKDVQSKTGFQFDVEEAVDTQSATSIFRPQSTTDNVASPKLVLKRQVGRKIGISFGSTVGVGSQVQREVNAEYRLNNAVSVQGVWNNIEEANTRETRTSFGLDFKLNRRFK